MLLVIMQGHGAVRVSVTLEHLPAMQLATELAAVGYQGGEFGHHTVGTNHHLRHDYQTLAARQCLTRHDKGGVHHGATGCIGVPQRQHVCFKMHTILLEIMVCAPCRQR